MESQCSVSWYSRGVVGAFSSYRRRSLLSCRRSTSTNIAMVTGAKEVITSGNYERHLVEILEYSIETFGHVQTCKYFDKISRLVESLETDYLHHSECPHLATKSRKYRNIFLDAHKIIYRVTTERIEVLDIVHSKSSITKTRAVRKIRL